MKKRQIEHRTKPGVQTGSNGRAAAWLVFAGILMLAAALRFSMLAAAPPGLCSDEAMNGVNLMEALEDGSWRVFYPDNYGREGLFINIQGSFVALQMFLSPDAGNFRIEPWMLRFPSAVFGFLTVAGLYLLASRMASNRIAAAAALFLATSFWHLNFSRIGFRAISAPFFLVWSLYLLFAGFRELRGDAPRKGIWILAAAGTLYGAGFHSYIAYRITPLVILVVLVWLWRDFRAAGRSPQFLNGTGSFIALAIVAIVPLVVYFLAHPGSFGGRSGEISVLKAENPVKTLLGNAMRTAVMFNVAGDNFWRHNIAGKPQLFWPVGLFFLGGIGLTIWRTFSKERGQTALPGVVALIWLCAGAIPAMAARDNVPHALRGLLMVPACALLAAIGADWVWAWIETRYTRIAAQCCAGILAIFLTWNCFASYFGDYLVSAQLREAFDVEWVEIAREINGVPATANKYVVVPGAKLDARGVPAHLYPLALVAGAYNSKARAASHVHFVVERTEAERVSKEEGAYVYLLQSK